MSDKQNQPLIEILLITVKQAAEALQVSERTIKYLIQGKHLSAIRIGNQFRVDLDDIRALAKTGTSGPAYKPAETASISPALETRA